MERNFHDCGGAGWSQGPSEPVYQRYPPPHASFDSYIGNAYDRYGSEDSWRSSMANDSWRENRFLRISAVPLQFEELQGWEKNPLSERSRMFTKGQYNHLRQFEFRKPLHSQTRLKGRNDANQHRFTDRQNCGDEGNKVKAKDASIDDKKSNQAAANGEANIEETSVKMSVNEENDAPSIKEEEENDTENVQKEEEKTEKINCVVSEEYENNVSKSDLMEREGEESSKADEEDPAKKIIIRKDFTHDDIHHFKPIAIKEVDDKPKIKRQREPTESCQQETDVACERDDSSKLVDTTLDSLLPEEETGSKNKGTMSLEETSEKSVCNPPSTQSTANPELLDGSSDLDVKASIPKDEDVTIKRAKKSKQTDEDWHSGAKTTLLGPPPEDKREDLRRCHRPGLLGGPPPKPYPDEIVQRRTLKPGLLDGPRRDSYGCKLYSSEDCIPSTAGFRNGPLLTADNIEGLTENTLLCSEEIKKTLTKDTKDAEGCCIPEVYERITREMHQNRRPRAGKALLGAPPGRRLEHISARPGRHLDEYVSPKYYCDISDAEWREQHGGLHSRSYDELCDYHREGSSQGWRNSLYRCHLNDYSRYRRQEKDGFKTGNWDNISEENAVGREFTVQVSRDLDFVALGRAGRSFVRNENGSPSDIGRITYGSVYRGEKRSHDYEGFMRDEELYQGTLSERRRRI